MDVADIQWQPHKTDPIEQLDPLTLDEPETLDYLQSLQLETRILRETLHEASHQLAEARRENLRLHDRLVRAVEELRQAQADLREARASVRFWQR